MVFYMDIDTGYLIILFGLGSKKCVRKVSFRLDIWQIVTQVFLITEFHLQTLNNSILNDANNDNTFDSGCEVVWSSTDRKMWVQSQPQ